MGKVFLRFASAVLLPVMAMAAGSPVERAESLYRQTDYRASLKLLPQNSADPEVLALTGKNFFMLGDFKKAGELFEKAIALDPNNSEYNHWLGRVYGRRAEIANPFTAPGYATKARKYFEKAVELNPRNSEALNDLFEYYLEAPGFLGGGVDKANDLAQRIGALDPAELHYAQARIAEKNKAYHDAEQHLRSAASMAPSQIGRVIDIAKFLARRGRVQESDALFQSAAKIDPNSPKLMFARAEIYIEGKRNLNQAKDLLNKYMKANLTPDDPPRYEAEKLLKLASNGS